MKKLIATIIMLNLFAATISLADENGKKPLVPTDKIESGSENYTFELEQPITIPLSKFGNISAKKLDRTLIYSNGEAYTQQELANLPQQEVDTIMKKYCSLRFFPEFLNQSKDKNGFYQDVQFQNTFKTERIGGYGVNLRSTSRKEANTNHTIPT